MENGDINHEFQQQWRPAMIITCLNVLGKIIGVGVNLAPIGTFYNIYKKKSTRDFCGLPYVFALSTALLWILYGLSSITPHATLLLTINSTAGAIQIVYLTMFLNYATNRQRWYLLKVMVTCFTVLAIGSVVTLAIPKYRDSRAFLVRYLCDFFGVMYYGSPLTVARLVITTRSIEFLPIVLCCFLFINSVIWSCYSILTNDIYVMIPNAYGAFFGVAQLTLYLIYRNTSPFDPT